MLANDATQRRRIDAEKIQNTVLIWLDHNITQHNEDYQKLISQVRRVINNIHAFSDSDECIQFIQTIVDLKVCIIMPGFLAQHIVSCVHPMCQVDSIIIVSNKSKLHERWVKDWPKIKNICTEMESVCEVLKQVFDRCERNSMPLSFIVPSKKLDQLDPSFMYTRILKNILVSMEFEEKHFQEYIDYCREIFGDNKEETANVEKLEHEYSSRTPIWWYTYQCFLYPMLNRGLRLMDVDVIMKMGFFIGDLHRHIEELHSEQFADQYSPASFTVYRGQGLNQVDFEQLLHTKGGLISFNNFLSTSKRREISLSFAQYAATNPDLVGILFIMKIDPTQSTTPFASIREVSYFQTEDEVLFSMHTVFRICDIQPMSDSNRLYEIMLTLTSDDDEDLCELTYSIQDEIPSCTNGWEPLGLVLEKMGQFDKAEEVYQVVLRQTEYDLPKGSVYHGLGRIKFNQDKYEEAILFHNKAIKHYQENFSETSLYLLDIYNSIGMVYAAMKEDSTALSYFEKAVTLRQQSLCPDHSDLADPYSNIGNVYYRMGEFLTALSFYEKALAIRKQALPPNHPDVARCHYDIGMVYEGMNNYSEANSYFQRAVHIGQHSLPSSHPQLLKYRVHLERAETKL